jgi:3-oxoacyl-[acyl-carrier-protein] synthase-3
MYYTKIAGMGHYLPPRVVTNEELSPLLDISDEDIDKMTGVRARRYVEPGEMSCSDLAYESSVQALENAGMKKSELDCIIFATLSPDHFFPGSGVLLQKRLDVPGIPAIDIRNQCSGFIYGLAIADQFIKTGYFKKILLVGSEVHSTGLEFKPESKDVTIIFGDGSGSAVLVASDEGPGVISTSLHADGKFADELWVQAPGTRYHVEIDEEMCRKGMHYPKMNGFVVFRHGISKMSKVLLEVLAKGGKSLDEIALFIFHQANLRMIERTARKLKLSPDKVFNNIQKFGNTTAGSIPIALSEAMATKVVGAGDLVMLTAFGAGFTWGSALVRL